MQYITITDHSPTAHYAGGLPLDRLKRQWEDIARAQEKVKVRLLRGTESDILADGSLDYPDAVLEQLDVIVASVHNRYKMDADQMTRRIVTAMRRPQFKIWGHALGRYVLTRPPFAVHMEKVLDAVAESRAAVEINGDPAPPGHGAALGARGAEARHPLRRLHRRPFGERAAERALGRGHGAPRLALHGGRAQHARRGRVPGRRCGREPLLPEV